MYTLHTFYTIRSSGDRETHLWSVEGLKGIWGLDFVRFLGDSLVFSGNAWLWLLQDTAVATCS